MPHTITNFCTQCSNCLPVCPTGAIKQGSDGLWIDATLCNDCRHIGLGPKCVSSCPIDKPPKLLQAKKGRCKVDSKTVTSPKLFPNGKTNPFASAIVVWEACNLLAQRQTIATAPDEAGHFCYRRQVNGGRGAIALRIASDPQQEPPALLDFATGQQAIANWDIRAACLHLIFAAYATTLDQAWDQSFTVNDQQLSEYLGLDKRKDLSKLAKLTLIKDWVEQACKLLVSIEWSQQGRVREISLTNERIWQLQDLQHHFQTDEAGCRHLSGLTFQIKTGRWAQYLLNKQGTRSGTAFYQYGSLPNSLLTNVMSIWQQHEGAARMMLWLLFKTRIGADQRITISTLMRIGYGEDRLTQSSINRDDRKRLLRTFESDLEILSHYNLKPIFDPETYPPEIQPLWAKLADLPDDAEAALEFWANDGSQGTRLTDAAPRDKWHRLMHARLLRFELPPDWEQRSPKSTKKRTRKTKTIQTRLPPPLSGQQVSNARKSLQLSQRALANQLGKSQSWVRDIENGRLQASEKDRLLLSKVLGFT
ncbi:MAG: helix-turn-helix domain-containing protein [Leptolyngbyaceae cyanobacterium bins.349]|nr:helix-turn-helix domain-containing protein [Leptolyngbyaceae cyanobacterium bins.349]